jgi:hypothetical protein
MNLLVKIAGFVVVIFLIPIAVVIAINFSPYLYTKVHGDAGTEKLYQLYHIANNSVPVDDVMNFIKSNNIEFIEHEKDGIIQIYNESATNAETVLVWHKGGKVIHARFQSEP